MATRRPKHVPPTDTGFRISPAAPAADPVNPAHYRGDRVMRIIEEFGLDGDYCLGNVIKYVLRHKDKAGLVDLRKAAWYLQRAIARQEGTLK